MNICKDLTVTDKKLPKVVSKFVNSVTFKEATEEGLQISTARRDAKEVFGLTMLTIVKDLLNHFKRIRKVESDEEIYQIIGQISKEYWFFKVEEIAYCFQRIKAGEYVKILDSIDGGIIMLGLKAYDKERLDRIEAEHLNRKHENAPVVELAKKLGEALKKEDREEPTKDQIYEKVQERLIREKMEAEEKRLKYLQEQKERAAYILKHRKDRQNGN